MPKYVYDFPEGSKDQKDLLGGKGANLAEMTNLGLPVPPGFIITTEACNVYLRSGDEPPELRDEVSTHLDALEQAMGRKLGQPDDPLLERVGDVDPGEPVGLRAGEEVAEIVRRTRLGDVDQLVRQVQPVVPALGLVQRR